MSVNKLYFVVLFFCVCSVFGQDLEPNDGKKKEFNSYFNKMSSGKFSATANGVLFVKNQKNQEFILDFQGSKASLFIESDQDEVYDVSVKHYQTTTTSGRTKVVYGQYGLANQLTIIIDNQEFMVSGIDGACDMVISGLDYYFKGEKDTEYLVLNAQKSFSLISERGNKITILPKSCLVFAVKK